MQFAMACPMRLLPFQGVPPNKGNLTGRHLLITATFQGVMVKTYLFVSAFSIDNLGTKKNNARKIFGNIEFSS